MTEKLYRESWTWNQKGEIWETELRLLQTRDVSKVKSEAGLFETFEEDLEGILRIGRRAREPRSWLLQLSIHISLF